MNIRITKLIALFALAAVLIIPDTAFAQRGDSGGRTRTRGGGSGSSAALQAQSKVLAVADERSNSLIIIAAEDQIAMIEELIKELDDNIDDLTEVRVIKLENADPTEMAEQINELFGSSQNTQPRFGPSAFFGGRGGSGGQSSSERGKRSTQEVVAIADPRTASLIISAPRQMIATVESLVKQLDSNSAKRQKVFIYTMEYADVNNAAELLRTIFEGDDRRTTQTQDSALRSRSGGFGTAGSANTTGGGGARGGGAGGIGGR